MSGLPNTDNRKALSGSPSGNIANVTKVSPEITQPFSVLDLQKQTAPENISYLRSKLEDHHCDEGKCYNLSICLIGEQAIVLALTLLPTFFYYLSPPQTRAFG